MNKYTEAELTAPGVENRTAGTVMAGVVIFLAQHPELRAMAAENDAEHFVEGCRNPEFMRKFAQALATIRTAALTA